MVSEPNSTDYDAFGFKVGYQFSAFSVSSVTSHLDYKNIGAIGLDVPGFEIPGLTYFTRINSDVTSEEVNLNSTLDGPWRWSAGGMYRKGSEDSWQYVNLISPGQFPNDDTSKSYAIYGELTRLLLENRLELTAGFRYFHDDITQEGQVAAGDPLLPAESIDHANTPRAVVTWHATSQVTVYTSYSEGFRSGFPQTATVLQGYPNFTAVRPDLLRNVEIGTKGSLLNGQLAFDASVYHIDWKDIQLLLAVPLNGVPYPGVVNGARAKGDGVDLALTVRVAEGLTVSPYVSWNDLKLSSDVLSGGSLLYERGDRPSGSPETTAGISADYAFGIGSRGTKARLSASANYTSSQAYRTLVGDAALVQDSSNILISRASFALDFLNHWSVTLYGNNLNNEHGTTSIMFPGVVPDWQARVRPLTAGVQAEYHLR